jgi:small basic protein (TIGR04137 family)
MSVDANEPREGIPPARCLIRADSHRLPLQDDSFAAENSPQTCSLLMSKGPSRKFLKNPLFFGLPRLRRLPSFRPPRPSNHHHAMSKHNSLKSSATVGGKRSVLKRFERVKLMKERGEWKDGRSPVGLPKTKHEG